MVDNRLRINGRNHPYKWRKWFSHDSRGVRVSTSYNPLGKPVGVHYQGGTRSTSTYDSVSIRILLADSTGRYTRTYDPLNRTAVSQ